MLAICLETEMAKHGVSPAFFTNLRMSIGQSVTGVDDQQATNDRDCALLDAAVKRITGDRANPDKAIPNFTETEYRLYTDCPAGRAAWAQQKAQEAREKAKRLAKAREEEVEAAVAKIGSQSLPSH